MTSRVTISRSVNKCLYRSILPGLWRKDHIWLVKTSRKRQCGYPWPPLNRECWRTLLIAGLYTWPADKQIFQGHQLSYLSSLPQSYFVTNHTALFRILAGDKNWVEVWSVWENLRCFCRPMARMERKISSMESSKTWQKWKVLPGIRLGSKKLIE